MGGLYIEAPPSANVAPAATPAAQRAVWGMGAAAVGGGYPKH